MTNYIEIKLKLKLEQYTGLNKWKCTVLGEERYPTCQIGRAHV